MAGERGNARLDREALKLRSSAGEEEEKCMLYLRTYTVALLLQHCFSPLAAHEYYITTPVVSRHSGAEKET